MAKICSVDGCNNKHNAKGFCYNHYRYWKRYGDPLQRADPAETRKKISEAGKDRKPSDETRKKISESKKGKPRPDLIGKIPSEETRNKISKAHKGKKFSDEHRKNLSKAMTGRPSPRKGIPVSDEQKRKQSEKMKGRPSPMKGKKQSDEARKKISEKAIGRPSPRKGVPHTKEANEKNRIAHLGKKATKESKKKMSISQNKPETLQKNRDRRAKQVFPKKDSVAEKFMQELCKSVGIQFTIHKNFNLKFQWHQVDIFIEPNICVEIDGDYPHANPNPYLIPSRTSTIQPGIKPDQIIYRRTASSIREKDRQITEALIRQGNHVIRFWQSELEQNPEKCIKKIKKLLNSSK